MTISVCQIILPIISRLLGDMRVLARQREFIAGIKREGGETKSLERFHIRVIAVF